LPKQVNAERGSGKRQDDDGDGSFGDFWGNYGNTDFNEFFGPGNPHASFYADTVGNEGGVYQQAILATPGAQYRFVLSDVRLELYFDADLYFGLEYSDDDDFTKLGETIVQIDTSTTGDGLSFTMTGTAAAGTVYIRPVILFDNVSSTGGTLRNAFVFECSLTELESSKGDVDCDGDVDAADVPAFVEALTEPAQYLIDFPGCDLENADINSDTQVDGRNIDGFVELRVGT
jgi:hypothetical protein